MTKPLKINLGFLQKIVPKTKKAKILVVGITAAILILFAYLLINHSASNTKIVGRVNEIYKGENLECQDVINKVGGYSADDVNNYEDKKRLLQLQVECFSNNAEYDKAINAAQELRVLYASKSDKKSVEQIEQGIQNLKDIKTFEESRKNNDEAQ